MKRAAIVVGVLVLVGCFGSKAPQGQADVRFGADWERSYDAAPPIDSASLVAGEGITVAPDRAVMRADVRVRAESYAAASERVLTATLGVIESLSEAEGCSAALVDQHSPRRESEQWAAAFSVRMDVDVKDVDDVHARAQRIDRCIGQFHALSEDAALAGATIAVGEPVWIVDDALHHRPALLEQRFATLRALESAPDRPPSFRLDALTCTSKGSISAARSSIAGVTLVVDFTCTP